MSRLRRRPRRSTPEQRAALVRWNEAVEAYREHLLLNTDASGEREFRTSIMWTLAADGTNHGMSPWAVAEGR